MYARLITVAVIVASVLCGMSASFGADSHSTLTKRQRGALESALQKYGWAIPVCVWPIRTDSKPYCYTVSRLIQRYPFHTRYISQRIYATAEGVYIARGLTDLAPEKVLEKLLGAGIMMGCVPKGKNRGPIILGQISGVGLPQDMVASNRLDRMKKACDTDQSSLTSGDVTLGLLAGSAPNTPYLSLSGDDQASYQTYLQECQSHAANPTSKVTAGGASATQPSEQELLEAGRKAKEEAAKKKEQAEDTNAAAKAAKQEQADLERQARNLANDPNATPEERAKAVQDAAQAAVDAQNAQAQADAASKDADDAQAAANQAQRAVADYYADQTYEESVQDVVNGAATIASGALIGAVIDTVVSGGVLTVPAAAFASGGLYMGTVYLVSGVAGATWGRYHYCLDDMSCSASCEAQAKARVIQDELNTYKKPQCNLQVRPLPDDDKCYDSPGGIFQPPQVTIVQALEWACKRTEKLDATCPKIFPELFTGRSFDPCHGPLVMCDPDQSPVTNPISGEHGTSGPTGPGPKPANTDIKSTPLPAAFHAADPGMWVNPSRTR